MKTFFIHHTGTVAITVHAKHRARQRFGWAAESLFRMADKAFYLGIDSHQVKGRLRMYFKAVWEQHKKANNIRLYGEAMFIFCDRTLITVWQLPLELRRLGRVLQQKCA